MDVGDAVGTTEGLVLRVGDSVGTREGLVFKAGDGGLDPGVVGFCGVDDGVAVGASPGETVVFVDGVSVASEGALSVGFEDGCVPSPP